MNIAIEQVDQHVPPPIGRMIQEVAEENGLDNFDFVPDQEYSPADAPFFHFLGRSDARIYMSGSDTYLCITDMTLDLFPLPTTEGKERIARGECWIIESGPLKAIQGEDTDEEGHYLTVYRCIDVSRTL